MQWLKVWKTRYRNYLAYIGPYSSKTCQLMHWQLRAFISEAILRICFRKKSIRRAEHIYHLEQKVKRQGEELRSMQLYLEQKNREHKALNILVACDGPCNKPYMDDPSSVNEEVVRLVMQNAGRLQRWWNRGGQKAAELIRVGWEQAKARQFSDSPPDLDADALGE